MADRSSKSTRTDETGLEWGKSGRRALNATNMREGRMPVQQVRYPDAEAAQVMFTVLIADDHPLFRAALCQVIAGLFNEHQIIEASTLDEARRLVETDADGQHHHAQGSRDFDLDMILLDLNMPGSAGFSGLVELRNAVPEVPIVVVSAATAPSIIRDSLTYGAAGFVPKSFSPGQIGDALRLVLNGEVFLPCELEEGRAGGNEPAGKLHDRVAALTPGELRVFQLLARGKSNKIIAYELGIKESTVKAHITAILRKLHVFSRTQAVIAARELGEF
jgi:Response regulator containing a CheY-like receiver domain and an HTH DNA-binding domain